MALCARGRLERDICGFISRTVLTTNARYSAQPEIGPAWASPITSNGIDRVRVSCTSCVGKTACMQNALLNIINDIVFL